MNECDGEVAGTRFRDVELDLWTSEGFELKIEVVLTSPPDEKVFRHLPEGFLVNLGVDPRTALKAMLVGALNAEEISPKAAHYVMRYSKFNVVPDLGGRIVPY